MKHSVKVGVFAFSVLGIATVGLALVACSGVLSVSVGSDLTSPEAGDDAALDPTADASTPTDLITRLEARCAAPSGSVDLYTSAATLSAHLAGRWYHCGSLGNWTLPPGTGTEFQFSATGSYAFLSLNDAGSDFVASTDPDLSGQILYQVFTGTQTPVEGGAGDGGVVLDGGVAVDGGGGSSATYVYVPVDDTTPLNGFFVYLTRADVADLKFQLSFEKAPRKMLVNELGGDPVSATFVPVD